MWLTKGCNGNLKLLRRKTGNDFHSKAMAIINNVNLRHALVPKRNPLLWHRSIVGVERTVAGDCNAMAILAKYIILPQVSGILWNSMSRSNSPVAEETLKGHVGNGTVPRNTTLQVGPSKPRRLSQRRGSPYKRKQFIIHLRDTKVVLPPNGEFGVYPPTPCSPHSHDDVHQDCNRSFITRACV